MGMSVNTKVYGKEVQELFSEKTKGIVFGSGTRQYGSFAKVTAQAGKGYEFAGWYIAGNLVSTDVEYKFRVTAEVEIVASFVETQPEETDTEETGGQENALDAIFRVVSHWNSGFSAEITLTNNTNAEIHNWVVAFDLPYDIVNIWDGIIAACEDGIYTVQNAGYNWNINPGQSVTFGFNADAETEKVIEPTQYNMVEMHAADVTQNYEIIYQVNSDWETAFNGQIEIRNLSTEDIYDWTLEFDCPHKINQFWTAQIVSQENNHYVIKNYGYNARIGAGETLILGFEACCGGENATDEPTNYKLTTVDMN